MAISSPDETPQADPKGMPPDQFREVRNLIERKVKELLEGLG
jgi:hypothetical protein